VCTDGGGSRMMIDGKSVFRKSNNICPACERFTGLYNRNGVQVGNETHNAHIREVSAIPEHTTHHLMWRVKHAWVCNGGHA